MSAPQDVRVSFLVPTLDRGHFVGRAVRSCLTAGEHAGISVEVVVVDSQSVDGSWELLQTEFADHPAVHLVQNSRGSGPLRSWLDAARLASGHYATFVWSDDYVAPHFLRRLVQEQPGVGHVAMGDALVRPISCETPLPDVGSRETFRSADLYAAYVGGNSLLPTATTLVSPASAIFTAEALRAWMSHVERLARSRPLAERLMWRAAIGPDLLLILEALSMGREDDVHQWQGPVVQFSAHPGSISVGSAEWTLRCGYWLARKQHLLLRKKVLDASTRSFLVGRLLLVGLHLLLRVPPAPLRDLPRRRAARLVVSEIMDLLRLSVSQLGLRRVAKGVLKALVTVGRKAAELDHAT